MSITKKLIVSSGLILSLIFSSQAQSQTIRFSSYLQVVIFCAGNKITCTSIVQEDNEYVVQYTNDPDPHPKPNPIDPSDPPVRV